MRLTDQQILSVMKSDDPNDLEAIRRVEAYYMQVCRHEPTMNELDTLRADIHHALKRKKQQAIEQYRQAKDPG